MECRQVLRIRQTLRNFTFCVFVPYWKKRNWKPQKGKWKKKFYRLRENLTKLRHSTSHRSTNKSIKTGTNNVRDSQKREMKIQKSKFVEFPKGTSSDTMLLAFSTEPNFKLHKTKNFRNKSFGIELLFDYKLYFINMKIEKRRRETTQNENEYFREYLIISNILPSTHQKS